MTVALPFTSAQTPSGALVDQELFPDRRAYVVRSAVMLGVDPEAPDRLAFKFTHRDGGVAVPSDGKGRYRASESPLSAVGTVPLDATGLPTGPTTLQWVRDPTRPTAALYYVTPEAINVSGTEGAILAQPDEMIDGKVARDAGNRPLIAPRYSRPIEEPVEPVDAYHANFLYMNMKGEVGNSTATHFTRKTDAERDALLNVRTYAPRSEVNKGSAAQVFDGTNRRFHRTLRVSPGQHTHLATGNAMVLGGVKYKKDKAKKGSHLREFLLMGFDTVGELTHRATINTEAPMVTAGPIPVGGYPIAGGGISSPLAAFVLLAKGKKKDPGYDPGLRRVLLVDVDRAEVLSEEDIRLPEDYRTFAVRRDAVGRTVSYEQERLSGEMIAVMYMADGTRVSEPLFGARAGGAARWPFHGNRIDSTAEVGLDGGRALRLYHVKNVETSVVPNAPTVVTDLGYLAFVVDAEGMPTAGFPLQRARDLEVVGVKGSTTLMAADFPLDEEGTAFECRLVEHDASTGELRETAIPTHVGTKERTARRIFDEERGVLYALYDGGEETGWRLLAGEE